MTASASPRILIVRLSAIGDVIHGLPLANALRARWPRAFLAWVVEGRGKDLVAGHPALDEVVAVPRGWLKHPATILDVRRRLRALNCDISIDVQGLTKSAIAARLSGAKRRIGFAGDAGRELSRVLNNQLVLAEATHVVDRNLELLRPLGISRPAVHFDLPEPLPAAVAADAIVESLLPRASAAAGNGRFALINPGAGWPSKLWPADRFAAVARHLGQRTSCPSIVAWAGSQEKAWAEQIAAGSGGHARLAPPTTLTELAALARRAAIFVSSDTGPLHIAAAVGTPCVALFGPMAAERNGPYGPGHIALQKATLTGSSRQRRTADNATMLAISVADVTDACDALLARADGRACA